MVENYAYPVLSISHRMLKRIIEIYILCLCVRGLYLSMLIIFSYRQKYSLDGERERLNLLLDGDLFL